MGLGCPWMRRRALALNASSDVGLSEVGAVCKSLRVRVVVSTPDLCWGYMANSIGSRSLIDLGGVAQAQASSTCLQRIGLKDRSGGAAPLAAT